MTNTNASHKDTRLLARLHPLLLALTLVLSPLLGLRSAHAASPDTIVAWGYNGYGQSNAPAGLHDVVAIAAGVYHSLALKGDGTVVAWGCGSGFDSGQCSVPAGLHDVVAIAAGDTHSLALKGDGTVVAWGDNGQGQSTVPAGLYDVVALAAGSSHSLALKGDGTVVAWGNNFEGQSTVPAGLHDVVALAAGWFHSLALKGDGTVVAWGCGSGGDSGQCSVPAGLSDVVATAAGYRHSLALKGDGTVVAWGCGSGFDSGQCSVPAGLHDVVAIAAGNSHNLALKRDGRVVAWGYNGYGQSTVPAGLYDVVALAAGVFHSLAIGAVDATAPTASPTQSPAAPGNGWNNSDVTVTWNWTDQADGSGLDLAHCTTSSTSSGEGARSLTATCTDLTGNQGSASYTVQVDKTPPTLSPLVSPNSVALGGTATVTSGAADALSGLASESCGALDTSSVGVKSVSCTATDNAGNTASATSEYTVNAPPLRQQVQSVRSNLAGLLPSGDSKTDKSLQKALGKLDQALAANLWETDDNHLTLLGDDVFNRLYDAVQALTKLKNPSPAIRTASSTLVTISRALVQLALDEAIAGGGDAGKIAQAQSKLGKGDGEVAKGKLDKAIAQYEDAWEYAQQALGRTPVLAAGLDPVADEEVDTDDTSDPESTAESLEDEAAGEATLRNVLFLPLVNR